LDGGRCSVVVLVLILHTILRSGSFVEGTVAEWKQVKDAYLDLAKGGLDEGKECKHDIFSNVLSFMDKVAGKTPEDLDKDAPWEGAKEYLKTFNENRKTVCSPAKNLFCNEDIFSDKEINGKCIKCTKGNGQLDCGYLEKILENGKEELKAGRKSGGVATACGSSCRILLIAVTLVTPTFF